MYVIRGCPVLFFIFFKAAGPLREYFTFTKDKNCILSFNQEEEGVLVFF